MKKEVSTNTAFNGSITSAQWPSKTFTWNSTWPSFADWTIGFDRQFKLFDELSGTLKNTSYPPYNIRKIDEENYELELAVAGFSKSDIEMVVKDQVLTIKGTKVAKLDSEYIHKGIGERDFTQSFVLAEYVKIVTASMNDGILNVKLTRELPEEKKPRSIEIE